MQTLPGRSFIRIKNARHNNLRGLDIDIPLNSITVITGPSGSGKSTLAMDILLAEGQRRYIEALGLETAGGMPVFTPPMVDEITSLPPAVALSQKACRRSSRSTLATFAGMARLLRLLFARCGTLACPGCKAEIHPMSVEEMAKTVLDLGERTRIIITAPLTSPFFRAMPRRELKEYVLSTGFVRMMLDGETICLEDMDGIPMPDSSAPALVIDRIINKPGIMARLVESLRLALGYGEGVAGIYYQHSGSRRQDFMNLVDRNVCPECRIAFPELSPGLFTDDAVTPHAGIASHVIFNGRAFPEVWSMTVHDAALWCEGCLERMHSVSPAPDSGSVIIPAMLERLRSLDAKGLGHVCLNRRVRTLSDGEFQKLRLASVLARDISGALFILDEPSAFMSENDFHSIWEDIEGLARQGNTVVMVEHVPWFIKRADYVIELGPGAGVTGGSLLFQGAAADFPESGTGVTAPWLERRFGIAPEPECGSGEGITVTGRLAHGSARQTMFIPERSITAVTGPVGSGKSLMARAIFRQLSGNSAVTGEDEPGEWDVSVSERMKIDDVIMMDSAPAVSSRSSVPATYLDVFTPMRQLLSQTPDARARGIKPAYFLFSRKGGRCEACSGTGVTGTDPVLPSAESACPVCEGRRYMQDALEVKYRGMNIADMLEMNVSDALRFFSRIPRIRRPLEMLERAGLDYLALGQPLSAMSGGELQRLKLARELASAVSGPGNLYLMDTPSRGLHEEDVRRGVGLLREIREQGKTRIAIEQQQQIPNASDHVIRIEGRT